MKYNITKFPIVILSAPRTGSTALAHEISEQLGDILFINEPFNPHSKEKQELIEISLTNQPYVLKTHIDEFLYPEFFKKVSLEPSMNSQRLLLIERIKNNECYVIRVRRRNIAEQIASFYIEMTRSSNNLTWKDGYWFYHKKSKLPDNIYDPVPLNGEHFDYAIHRSLLCNELLDKFTEQVDLDIWLEDVEINPKELVRTPKPENYLEIKNLIKRKLIEKRFNEYNEKKGK
jgi:hypothetical protein